ncbi:T6SS effector BTH_I2691 family protein [Pseudomonas sp. microsymbiont 2]
MTLSERIAHAIAESVLPLDQCQACERKGLPILPLRRALVPDQRPAYRYPLAGDDQVATRLGLRTLRTGYLYVLLDQRIWYAYEVTDEAHLRRFNPIEPPPAPPQLLARQCLSENHDIPSSFLTIDTEAFSTAWIAFSSDAWPPSVLNAYRSAKTPPDRFQVLDLGLARNAPDQAGLAMTHGELRVDRQVFEYSQQLPGAFDSVHGFHSRFLRQTATRGYLVNAIARHQLEHGVLALVLDDTVGLVQEYNHQRLNWIARRQQWREDPLRAYQLQTSQILQTLRAMQSTWAEQQTPSFEPHSGDGPPVFVDPRVERQREVERRTRDGVARLEERYHEPLRAGFQADYERQEAEYQHYIDLNTQAYTRLCDSSLFRGIEEHDYDGDDRESGIAYSKTMALCLAGGVTEAPDLDSKPRAPTPGSSAELWRRWLQDPNSPPYRAVLLRDRALLAALLPSFSTTDPTDWGDSDKLYGVLSKLIASDDTGLNLRDSLRQAIAETQGAINGASLRLKPLLPPGVQRAVIRLNSASQWLYNGVQLIELQVRMKLSEYYALQSAHLRELQHKASAQAAKARERMLLGLGDLDDEIHASRRWVRPVIQHGLLSLAVLDPKLAHSVITVSAWVEGTADVLRERLTQEAGLRVNQLSDAAQINLVNLTVAAGTLDASARQLLHGMRITAQQAAQLVRTSFTGVRGVAGSWELLLALGGLYLTHDSLTKNLEKAEVEIGEKSREAVMALHGSKLAILGGEIEALGLIIRTAATQINTRIPLTLAGTARMATTIKMGRATVRLGAVMGAVAGIYDTAQAVFALKRTWKGGDKIAASAYTLAAATSAAGVIYSTIAVFNASLMGPLGIAIILAATSYGMIKLAKNKESSSIERWAMRCHFGKANESPAIHWEYPEHADIAFAALNAATLGVEAGVKFETQRANPALTAKIGWIAQAATEQKLTLKISLPNINISSYSYHWSLTVHRHGDGLPSNYTSGETIASGSHEVLHPLPTSQKKPSSRPARKVKDYRADTLSQRSRKETSGFHSGASTTTEFITGHIELTPSLGKHNILAATLSVIYWPDRNTPDAYAHLEIQAINE